MSWRTVVISQRCKLDYKMGYLVIRNDAVQKIFLKEIAVLIIEDPAVSMTGVLLEMMTEQKIKIIFCNARHLPMGELVPYSSNVLSAQKIREQIQWEEGRKISAWLMIVEEKLKKQIEHLELLGLKKELEMIRGYLEELRPEDPSHREAHAAKVYFNAVFGMDFSRSKETFINAALNYGYTIIMAAFSREISATGYLTQLGLNHRSVFNAFNLASDLMEPFRVLVDRAVLKLEGEEFGKEQRHCLAGLLGEQILFDGEKQTVLNAIRLYARSVFDFLNGADCGIKSFSLI